MSGVSTKDHLPTHDMQAMLPPNTDPYDSGSFHFTPNYFNRINCNFPESFLINSTRDEGSKWHISLEPERDLLEGYGQVLLGMSRSTFACPYCGQPGLSEF